MGAEMDLSGSEVVMDEEAAVTALEFMHEMLDGIVAAPTGDYGTAVAEFLNEESGIFLTGVWELPTMKAAGIAFDARTIPTLYGTDAVYGDSHAFVLPNQSAPDEERRRETYRFVAEILKGSFAWAGAGHIPAYSPIVDDPAYAELVPQASYANAADLLRYDPEAWFSGSGSDFQTYFMENVQGVLLGQTDAATGLDGFVRRLNSLLAKPNPVTG
jgi:multiple sugar transport system substrate-binding protein